MHLFTKKFLCIASTCVLLLCCVYGCDINVDSQTAEELAAVVQQELQEASEAANNGQMGQTPSPTEPAKTEAEDEGSETCPSVDNDKWALDDQPGGGLREGDIARVGHVIDGDTLDVIAGGEKLKVRVQGINAPECHKDQNPRTHRYACVRDDEGYGLAAYTRMAELVEGAHVRISCEEAGPGEACPTDPYDRYLAHLELPCIGDVGRQLVAEGLAQTFTRYACDHRASYCKAEYEARQARAGMWSGGTIRSMLEKMSEKTRSWYRTHDARCDAALK